MDKGRQPAIWGNHNFGKLMGEAFRRNEEKEKARAISEILDQPDGVEKSDINVLSDNALSRLSNALDDIFEVSLSPSVCGTVSVKLFNPHECVVDDSLTLSAEISTSVVALDAYGPGSVGRDGEKVGSVLLFKLSANLIDEPVPDMTAKDLAWGENCTYGVLVGGDAIDYFKITQTSGDVVRSELRRKDSTEESGHSVEAQVVEPGKDRLVVQKLFSSSEEGSELDQELEKFIASRSAQ